ncbi:unnamed protein product [Pleuronectes platessa]|uniref:Uncharacterized protein n=1 Tax=Pleuronectes platessa TaxID=8262 RepID=A0A9N7YSE1_PLEPL|nr:unnamed protein product [Pleuronectes platessa]
MTEDCQVELEEVRVRKDDGEENEEGKGCFGTGLRRTSGMQRKDSSSTPESALITKSSGSSSSFQVDVFVLYVYGSSSSSS